jgi:pimeloyl-ACP methyl ester carboxylesterase
MAGVLQERYGELRLPVTIVTGAADQVVEPARHSRRLHRELPGSRLVEVPGAGHMIHHSAPDAVLEAIEAVMSRAFGPAERSRSRAELREERLAL